mgnify:CR=1 FL=1
MILTTCLSAEEKQNMEIRDFGKFSQYYFPSKGAFDFDEGTYEAWWRVDFDKEENFQTDINYAAGGVNFFSLRDAKGNNWSKKREDCPSMDFFITDTKKDRHVIFRTRLALNNNRPAAIGFTFSALGWNKADWHYVAFSWKKNGDQYDFILQCDDKSKSLTATVSEVYSEAINSSPIINLGGLAASSASLDCVQISQKPLTSEQLDKSFVEGIKKSKSSGLYKTGADLLKLKEIKLSQSQLKLMESNTAKKKLKVKSSGAVFGKPLSAEGKFSKNAAQLHTITP